MSPEQPQFATARKGYKTDEVDAYVVQVLEEADNLRAQLHTLQGDLGDAYDEATELRNQLHVASGELQKANQELGVTREQEEALRMTLVSASRTKDEMLAGAQLEAENMVAEATTEAASIVTAARDEARRLDEQTSHALSELELRRSQTETEQRAQAEAYASRLGETHRERLAALSQLEAMYQSMSQSLERMLADAHREMTAEMGRFSDVELEAPAPAPSPPVEAAPPSPPEPQAPEMPPPPHSTGGLSALDKIASLTGEPDPTPSPGAASEPPTETPAAPTPASVEFAVAPSESNDAQGDAGQPLEHHSAPDPNPLMAPADVAEADAPVDPAARAGEAFGEPGVAPPEPEPTETATAETETETAEAEPVETAGFNREPRDSFYNRRSGRLPRLGDDRQKDANASIASLRDKI